MNFVRDVRLGCNDSLVTHETSLRSLLGPGYAELEVLGLGITGANRDRGRLRSQPLVPGGDLIAPRVKTRDRELPVRARHREEGMRKNADIGAHPGADAALDLEHVLRLGEV